MHQKNIYFLSLFLLVCVQISSPKRVKKCCPHNHVLSVDSLVCVQMSTMMTKWQSNNYVAMSNVTLIPSLMIDLNVEMFNKSLVQNIFTEEDLEIGFGKCKNKYFYRKSVGIAKACQFKEQDIQVVRVCFFSLSLPTK